MTQVASQGLYSTDLALPGLRRGKVRDVYDLPAPNANDPRLLIVATDRISAFDVVMPTPIPGKGRLLTQLSVWWLRFIESKGICRTHLISQDAADVPAEAFSRTTSRGDLIGRIMIGRKAQVVPVECVVRGYLEGSGWKEYKATGSVCGIKLPPNLRQCDRLPEPIFTPATKEEQGRHDENISFAQAGSRVGQELMQRLRDTSLRIYSEAAAYALSRGVIIADTKFEFGIPIGEGAGAEPILIDEALTPDSSRFWPAAGYEPGHAQASFDKQYLREYLEGLVAQGRWNKQAPGPELPREIVSATLDKYREATERLTGTGRT